MENQGETSARLSGLDRRPSLLKNVGLPIVAAFLLNGVIFALDLNRAGPPVRAPFAPPGAVIGAFWIVLISMMGLARWRLSGTDRPAARRGETWVTILLAACLAYPLYTGGLSDINVGLVGNALTVALALAATILAWRAVVTAGLLVLPTFLWSVYALAIMIWNVRHV